MRTATIPSAGQVWQWTEAMSLAAIHAAIAVGIALTVHFILFAVLDRAARLSASTADEVIFGRLRQPLRFGLIAVALALTAEASPLVAKVWELQARFLVPALLGWTGYALVKGFASVMDSHAQAGDDVHAVRSRRTRIAIFSRTLGFLIVFFTVALMLLGIPGVRNVGVTLVASAGFATLAVGAAAQPALKSLIAGLQIALTEPIRLGDFVLIDGESGRVEDIRLSYVVIRTADERRIIVPTAKFLDGTFQNWSRVGGGITGSVVLPIRPGEPIEPIRAAYLAALEAHEDWDRRTGSLDVSEVRPGSVDLKLVMSARGPTELNRLRPAMREAMLAWLAANEPAALVTES